MRPAAHEEREEENLRPEGNSEEEIEYDQSAELEEFVPVETTENAAASAGNGLEVYDEGLKEVHMIPAKLLRDSHITTRRARSFRIRGDSMQPRYENGSLALLDIDDRNVRSGCAYLIRQDGTFYFKRISVMNKTQIELLSDNPRYKPITLTPEDGQVEIIGRIFAALNLE